ncbi:uncharacterized protein LOC130799651 isoform X2 [Amaranthus tricolor]|nr:uncharacterized protein LOC130799651 isoform X2 [Amaranthus tricolor]
MSVKHGDQNAPRDYKNSSKPDLLMLGSADGLKSDLPVGKPHLLSQDMMNGDDSDELADVRVCDICGDVGREVWLVLCSKCDDGAEHTYCMTPKMDKVPEDDWLCEDCVLIKEQKRPRQSVVERLDNGSPTTIYAGQPVGKMRINHLSEASGLSDKGVRPTIDMRSETKKRTLDRRVQSQKHYGSGVKTQLTRISSLKNLDKGNHSVRQVSSFDLTAKKVVKQKCSSAHSSSKSKQQTCGGSVDKSKESDGLHSIRDLQCSQEDARQRRRSFEESAGCELKKNDPDKKLLKSLPSTGVGSGPPDASNKKYFSVEKKNSQLQSPFSGSSPSKAISCKTKVISKPVKSSHYSRENFDDKQGNKVTGNTNVKALVSRTHEVVGHVDTSRSPCRSSYMITSPTKNVADSPDQTVNLSTPKVDSKNITQDDNDPSTVSFKVLPFDSQHVEVMPITLDQANDDHLVSSAHSAVPESTCSWKGTFKLEKSGKLLSDCSGIQAHLSTRASPKVNELVHKFSTDLRFNEVPRLQTWPIQFQKNYLGEQDIALYFFAQDLLSYQRSYRVLLEGMTNNDLALEANFGDFQLLVFPSNLLPLRSQCWNSLPYLWGVFRGRKVYDSYSPGLNTMTVSEGLCSPVTHGPESKLVSAPCTFENSIQGSEVVDLAVLQSSAPIKVEDQGYEYDLALLEEDTLKRKHIQADTVPFVHDRRKDDLYSGLLGDDLQKQNTFIDEDTSTETDFTRFDTSAREYTAAVGLYFDSINKGQTCTPVCDSASGIFHRHDVGSTSFSLNSSPSASSDCTGYAKMGDEGLDGLDLNLRLGTSSQDVVDLDLVLGLPTRLEYQPKQSFMDEINREGNVSLVLSLGQPYSYN